MKSIHKIKRLIVLIAVASSLMFSLSPALVLADAKSAIGEGVKTAGGSSGGTDLGQTAKNAVKILSIIVGIVAVIMIILGGFKYITSGGDATKVASAKNTIFYAVIGLVIVALAQLIVRFVLTKATTGDSPGRPNQGHQPEI